MPPHPLSIFECRARPDFLRWPHRSGRKPNLPDPKAPASWEDDVKELNLEEVLRIAGGVPVSAALDELTYRVPQELDVRAGHRVLVPLGKRRVVGIALEPVTRVAPGVELRDILRVLDPEPLLSPELLTLGLWIAEYYVAPIGEVFRAMLPLRAETRRVRLVKLTEAGRQKLKELEASLLEEARRGPEADLLRYLAGRPGSEPAGVPIEGLRTRFSAFRDLVPQALEEGWIGVLGS